VVALEQLEVSATDGAGNPKRNLRAPAHSVLESYLREAWSGSAWSRQSVRDDARHELHPARAVPPLPMHRHAPPLPPRDGVAR